MDNYVSSPILTCKAFNHRARTFCLPEKQSCDMTTQDGLFYPTQWNCNRPCASDQEYYWPVPTDGKVMFQTNFNLAPGSSGWDSELEIELFDNDNVSQGWGTGALASQYVIGNSGKFSYQTIEIDFSLVSALVTCGYFKITYGEDVIFTQQFKIDPCACLVKIEGVYTGYDCWNNYYGISKTLFNGTSNFAYSNAIYIDGSTKYFGTAKSDSILTENLRMIPKKTIPPYMERYLSFKILKAKTALVDGELWNNKDQAFTPREKTSMFWPIIEFDRKACTTNDACAN